VKRAAVSGGPYSVIASPTSTSYTDTGLANGTTYYYVVSAVNSLGESAASSKVSATPQVSTARRDRFPTGALGDPPDADADRSR
jgi:fibronectin type 3 domain-containing protein